MSAKNPRINVTFQESTAKLLALLAKKESKSMSKIARELILEALERREDLALSDIAKIRDTKKAKKVKHEEAWK